MTPKSKNSSEPTDVEALLKEQASETLDKERSLAEKQQRLLRKLSSKKTPGDSTAS
jgi:hypothetical protein